MLVVIILVVALSKRRRSSVPSSHFIDEDRHSQHRSFTPLASQELSKDLGPDDCTEYNGGFFHSYMELTLGQWPI